METIQRVVITEVGGVDVLKIVETSCSPPAPGFARRATEYSGFTGGDISMRKGIYPDQKPAPLTPVYFFFVERVQAVGEGCTQIQQAYTIATQIAKVDKNQRVFVHGISGADGCALMIPCSLMGAEVYGTASERNQKLFRAYGATPFVYTDKKWIAAMKDVGAGHAVLDPLGFESFEERYSILTSDGIIVAYGNNMDSLAGPRLRDPTTAIMKMLSWNSDSPSGKKTTFFGRDRDSPNYANDVSALMNMMAEGRFQVSIKKVWAMGDVEATYRQWGGGHGIGSVLIKIHDLGLSQGLA
ncbi:hypothetical protein N7456_013513 [Penicillium angulare]|uniref:Uncharacterized protein n=1 Tax=Penicillium angulare TaxID=116970 RepID=A0A9W9JSM3_9EURO|nr:hypothetical protein N7456_013513 [Penicillium angulare]